MKADITDDNKLLLIPESDVDEKFLFSLARGEVSIDVYGHANLDPILIHAVIAYSQAQPNYAPEPKDRNLAEAWAERDGDI